MSKLIGRPVGTPNRIIPGTDILNTPENIFYRKVLIPINEDGCMEWTGVKRNGYGRMPHNKKLISAHRYSYELHVEKIPKGLCVLHRCDNPSCVRPDHLFLGSYHDNNKDRAIKGRNFIASGEKNGNSKLTEIDIRGIRRKINIGYSVDDLSILYNVCKDTIYKIKDKKLWGAT